MLLAMGEIGKNIDLSDREQLIEAVLRHFESPESNTRIYASIAFGGMCIGNTVSFMPLLSSNFEKHKKN